MYAKNGQTVTFIAGFTAAGLAAVGLTVTCKVWELRSGGTKVPDDTIGTTSAVYEIGGGLYATQYTVTADCVPVATFSTAGTADIKAIQTAALSLVNLDVLVSTRNALAPLTSLQTENAVWNARLSDHNTNGTYGKRIKQIAATNVHEGYCAGPGVNGNQIILDNAASSIDGAYDPSLIFILEGPGAGQCRLILHYDGLSKTATLDRDWKVLPDGSGDPTGSYFVILGDAGREHVNEGLCGGVKPGTDNTIILNAAASTYTDAYKGQRVFIRSGHGSDQARRVDSSGVETIDGEEVVVAYLNRPWSVNPDTTSAYVMLPTGAISDQCIADAVWQNTDNYADGTKGAAIDDILNLTSTDGVVVATNNDKTGYTLDDASVVATAVWSSIERTLTAFDFEVDVDMTEVENLLTDLFSQLSATGNVIVGQGRGSETFTDTVEDAGTPISGIIVKAYAITNNAIVWSTLVGMHVSNINGDFTLYLDPGDYMLSFEKNGAQVGTKQITVVGV